MKKIIRFTTLLSLTLAAQTSQSGLLDAFGIFSSSPVAEFQHIKFSNGVTKEQAEILKNDLKFLVSLKLSEDLDASTLSEISRVMKISPSKDSFGQDLWSWIKPRIQYIVGEDYSLEEKLRVINERQSYPNNIKPPFEKPIKEAKPGDTKVTVMTNLTPAVYMAGKLTQSLMGLELNGATVVIKSPRVGVIHMGPGLFGKTEISADLPPDSIVNRIIRLETLFHEARHSDGNGATLAFFHTNCTDGRFAGYPACDRNLNGPYTVGALILRAFKSACQTTLKCTAREITQLDKAILDSESRVIREQVNPDNDKIKDQIRTFKVIMEVCKGNTASSKMKSCNDLLESVKKSGISPDQFDEVLKNGLPPIMSTDWDDTPESI